MSTITKEARDLAIEHLYHAIKDLEQGVPEYDGSAVREIELALTHMGGE